MDALRDCTDVLITPRVQKTYRKSWGWIEDGIGSFAKDMKESIEVMLRKGFFRCVKEGRDGVTVFVYKSEQAIWISFYVVFLSAHIVRIRVWGFPGPSEQDLLICVPPDLRETILNESRIYLLGCLKNDF